MADIKGYLQETVHELVHKVTWPTWNELQNNTIIVVVASVIFSLLVLVMDKFFGATDIALFGDFSWKGVLGFIYDLF